MVRLPLLYTRQHVLMISVSLQGVCDESKLATIYKRAQSAIRDSIKYMQNLRGYNPQSPKLPPLLLGALLEVLREMEVEIRFEEGEADAACVVLAVARNAWILSNGQSFTLYDTPEC